PRELEVQVDAHLRTRPSAQPLDRLACPARGRRAVERPRNRLEQRRFAGAVGTDDAGNAEVEVDPRVDVLPEVAEVELIELHQPSTITAGATATAFASSMYATARAISVSRSMSASIARQRSFSATMSLRSTRWPPAAPLA